VDRRAAAVVALLLFVACTGVAIVISGARPANDPGVAPLAVQVVGYAFALVAGLLLVASRAADRRSGAVVLGALAVLVLLDVFVFSDPGGGANIGAGGVRLIGLVVIAIQTARLARGGAASRSERPSL
jgi:peptidoglycan/LPS O-acetylase OafA/YrhL